MKKLCLLGASVLLMAACDGGGTGPQAVDAVRVSASRTGSLYIGQSLQLSAEALASGGGSISGRAVSWQSSAPSVAPVSANGLVTGLSAGTATITATVDGKAGTFPVTVQRVPVSAVVATADEARVGVGSTVQLLAAAQDSTGAQLFDRTVSWTSRNSAIAQVSASGQATGVAVGDAWAIASAEGKVDSVLVLVRTSTAPVVTSVSPAVLTPGTVATITGSGFDQVATNNVVTVAGVPATVTAASATQLTVRLAASGYPCFGESPRPVSVAVAGDARVVTHPVSSASRRALSRGQFVTLSGADASCNEFAAGGNYLVSVQNSASATASVSGFLLRGVAGAGQVATAARQAAAAGVAARLAGPALALGAHDTGADPLHMALLDRDRKLVAAAVAGGRDVGRARKGTAAGLNLSVAAQDYVLGATVPMRIRDIKNEGKTGFPAACQAIVEVQARVVAVTAKAIVLEDNAAPLAGQMDSYYQSIAAEYDAAMHPIITENFGDPLKLDADTDQNGKLIMLFSKAVNDFSPGLLGFVSACDFFPYSATGNSQQGYKASNEAEIFYAIIPTNAALGFPGGSLNPRGSRDAWKRQIRSTLIHEVKHITAYAEKLWQLDQGTVSSAEFRLETSWLEEATAQVASEIYARRVYGSAWKGNRGYGGIGEQGPYCDVRPTTAACGEPPELLYHHLNWLQDFFSNPAQKSVVAAGSQDGTIYGSAWAFVRWATDHIASNEATFLKSIVQVANTSGVPNFEMRTGRQFGDMLGDFSVAMAVDDYPGFTPARAEHAMPSWNFRSIFEGMNRDYPSSNTKPVPQITYSMPAGAFEINTPSINGGTFTTVEVSGVTASQLLQLTAGVGSDSPAPAAVRMTVVRVQ